MNYASSGVNIEAGNKAVDLISNSVTSTYNSAVLHSLGHFAAAFRLDTKKYKDPILVSCTDGVGTKLRLAIDLKILDSVGIDLVAMSVNDLICMGAKPLFFLDYVACHSLIPEQIKQVIEGMVQGCKQADVALIGGEMAEMNDMYKKGDFDLAGFAVGIVDRPSLIDGQAIKVGDHVYGLASSGIHSNGFSLVRKVLTKDRCKRLNLDRKDLLTPTRIYVRDILSLLKESIITGLAHITGGGLEENIRRILPDGCSVKLTRSSIPILDIFKRIQSAGNISDEEMFKVFNMGIGMVVISPEKLADPYIKLGHVIAGQKKVNLV